MLTAIKALLFILCLVFYFLYRRDAQKWKGPLAGAAVAGLIAFVAGLFAGPSIPGGNPIPYERAIGYVLGDRVAQDVQPSRVIRIQSPGLYAYKAEAILAAQREGLQEALGDGVEWVDYRPPIDNVDTNEEDVEDFLRSIKWRRHFAAWLLDQPDADALVSFIGMPSSVGRDAMPKLPPVYAFSLSGMAIAESNLAQAGKLKAYATYRADYDPDRKPSGSSSENRFEARYRLIDVEVPE